MGKIPNYQHSQTWLQKKKTEGQHAGNQNAQKRMFESEHSFEDVSQSNARETATALAEKFGMNSASKFKHIVDYKSFPDRYACIAWICANQLHKHNMTELQRMKLIQEEYEARQKSIGAPLGNRNAKKQFGEIPQVVFTDLVTGEEKPLF